MEKINRSPKINVFLSKLLLFGRYFFIYNKYKMREDRTYWLNVSLMRSACVLATPEAFFHGANSCELSQIPVLLKKNLILAYTQDNLLCWTRPGLLIRCICLSMWEVSHCVLLCIRKFMLWNICMKITMSWSINHYIYKIRESSFFFKQIKRLLHKTHHYRI